MTVTADRGRAESAGLPFRASLIVLRNTFYTFASTVVSKGFIFLFVALGAKTLGPEKWGIFTLAITLVTLLRIFTDFGFQILSTREVAVRPARLGIHLWNATTIKLLLSVLSIGVLAIALRLLQFEAVSISVVTIYSLALLPHALYTSLLAVFNAQERMGSSGIVQLTLSGAQLFLGLAILRWVPDVVVLALSLPASMTIASALGVLILGQAGIPSIKVEREASRKLLGAAWPFMLTNVLTYAFQKADVLLLSIMRGDAQVGWYGAAYNFVDAIMFLPLAYTAAVFPRLSRIVHDEHDALESMVHRSLKHLVSLGLFFAVTLAVYADRLVLWVYKEAFSNSVIPLRILALGLVLMFPNSLLGYVLFSKGRQKELVRLFVFNLGVNLLLNAFAIPRYGAPGAAFVMVLSLVFSFSWLVHIVNRHLFRVRLLHVVGRAIAINAVYLCSLIVLYSWNAVISLILGVSAFLVLYWISGILEPEEKQAIWSTGTHLYQSLHLLLRKVVKNAG